MTYSIVAIDQKTQAVGVATVTANTRVGDRVPHAKGGVGAIATQGLTEVSYGIKGLELLERGCTPQEALRKMLKNDPEREHRQVMIIDVYGRKAAFTGKANFDFKGHIVGEDYIVGGNFLASENVIKEMAKAFETGNKFVEKLLLALEAGEKAGGDIRGERSAALIVMPYKVKEGLILRVDDSSDPINELKQLLLKTKRGYEL